MIQRFSDDEVMRFTQQKVLVDANLIEMSGISSYHGTKKSIFLH